MKGLNKLPEITILFWIIKIIATTLGETAGDLLSMTFHVGYAGSSVIFLLFFLVSLLIQLTSKRFHPIIYWTVILSTSLAGTTMSDFMDRSLGLGYATGTMILIVILFAILSIWKYVEKTISVAEINASRSEIFYWSSILASNTLGTALGDFLADDSGLGFLGGAALIGSLLIFAVFAYYRTKISHIVLFWFAFVLTRPFGATFGDLLTKSHEKGGLNFGTIGSTITLGSLLVIFIFISTKKYRVSNR